MARFLAFFVKEAGKAPVSEIGPAARRGGRAEES
jgi:hypothetical protein